MSLLGAFLLMALGFRLGHGPMRSSRPPLPDRWLLPERT